MNFAHLAHRMNKAPDTRTAITLFIGAIGEELRAPSLDRHTFSHRFEAAMPALLDAIALDRAAQQKTRNANAADAARRGPVGAPEGLPPGVSDLDTYDSSTGKVAAWDKPAA